MSEEKNTVPSAEEIVEATTIADIYRAAKQLEGITVKTGLIRSDFFSEACGNEVYIKPENLQHTGAFKLRGAYNRISQLTKEEQAKATPWAWFPAEAVMTPFACSSFVSWLMRL